MKAFLEQIADHFLAHHGRELYRYRFIFPTKRAGKFFLHYLSHGDEKRSILLPEVTTLTQLITHTYHDTEPEPIILILELYSVYRNLFAEQEEPPYDFDSFYPIGEMILNDFGDIDSQMADANRIFVNAGDLAALQTDIREILDADEIRSLSAFFDLGTLAPGESEGSLPHRRFLRFWQILPQLYDDFRLRLREKALTYPGMSVRRLAEDQTQLEEIASSKHNVIVGFYALTEAEKGIFSYLHARGGLFYRDIPDRYAAEVEHAESLDRLLPSPTSGHPDFIEFPNTSETRTSFEIYSFSSTIAQATFINQALRKEDTERINTLHTAVILPSERLLLPLISSLPATIPEVNVTMGYPLRDTQIVGFFEIWLQLRITRDLKTEGKKPTEGYRWRVKEISSLLSQQIWDPLFIHGIDAEEKVDLRTLLLRHLQRDNVYAINTQSLLERCRALSFSEDALRLLTLLFSEKIQGMELLHNVYGILDLLRTLYAPSDETMEEQALANLTLHRSVIPHLLLSLDQILTFLQETLADTEEFPLSTLTIFNILRALFRNSQIPFTGEPLRGLQIMGMLESRCLDFDTLYIPDASEGLLPQKRRVIGIIPYILRKGYGLPTYKWQDDIRSYHFFRLISRALRVIFTYDATKNSSSTGEVSRYLSILKYLYGADISFKDVSYPLLPLPTTSTEEVDLTAVERYRAEITSPDSGNYLSPSGIKDYLSCPRKFYYTRICNIREEEEVEELVQSNTLGNIVHRTLGFLLGKFTNREIDKGELSSWLKPDDTTVDLMLRKAFTVEKLRVEGFNEVQYAVAKTMVVNTLTKELDREESLTYLGDEYLLKDSFTIGDISVNLQGVIDRLDVAEGKYIRITDYKTGNDRRDFSLDAFTPGDSNFNGAAFQILSYCYLVERHWPDILRSYPDLELRPALSKTVEDSGDELLRLRVEPRKPHLIIESYHQVSREFAPIFERIVHLITTVDQSFVPYPGSMACNYCIARNFCIYDKYPTSPDPQEGSPDPNDPERSHPL